MRGSTILRPALLGRPSAYRREAARVAGGAGQPGLFDLPLTEHGPDCNTQSEAYVVRTFDHLAEAFGLSGEALVEWHAMFDRGAAPHPMGPLAHGCRTILPDLMQRVQTLALFQDRKGQGHAFMAVWRRARPLKYLFDTRAALLRRMEQGVWVHEEADGVEFTVLDCFTLRVDHARQSVTFRLPRAEAQRSGAVLDCSYLLVRRPGTWVRYWLDQRVYRARDGSVNVPATTQWLLEEPGVPERLFGWREVVLRHPLWPIPAMELADATYGKAFSVNAAEGFIGMVWRSMPLYQELADHSPRLAALMPPVHYDPRLDGRQLNGMGDLRGFMIETGLTPAGWRWLVRRLAADPGVAPRYAYDTACFMAECGADFAPSAKFVEAAARLRDEFGYHTDFAASTRWLWPMAWVHCRALLAGQGDPAQFLEQQFRAATQWVLRTGWRPDANQRRAGWGVLHRAMAKGLPGREGGLGWPVPVAQLARGDLVATCLRDGDELWEEGRRMQHCVHDYLGRCLAGTMLVFSVSNAQGRRVATMSLQREHSGAWTVHQCLGWCNQAVLEVPAMRDLWRDLALAVQGAAGC
ncbi:MAG: PcfJ domain-containing protein [Burkholderiales bacterium]|nr:PcfJ domain-containing protein [Burkholderiales bacterium]